MKRSILITGGAGFIGSHVVEHFCEKYPEYEIIVLDKLTYAANPEFLYEMAETHENLSYAITDLYKVDPRFGSNDDYLELTKKCREKNIKVVMDMVFNHVGTNHYLVKDPPEPDWIHQWDTFTRSNYRGEVTIDPYASEYDLRKMEKGWFDVTMADLNQSNPHVIRYLIQNSIWWIVVACSTRICGRVLCLGFTVFPQCSR